jgi:hypothetical protein
MTKHFTRRIHCLEAINVPGSYIVEVICFFLLMANPKPLQ